MIRHVAVVAVVCTVMPAARCDERADVKAAIDTIRQVGPEGKGSAEAAGAWKVLAKVPIDHLPTLLAGMDGATPLARNWIRAAVDEVVDRAERGKQPLPTAALEGFLTDTKHD